MSPPPASAVCAPSAASHELRRRDVDAEHAPGAHDTPHPRPRPRGSLVKPVLCLLAALLAAFPPPSARAANTLLPGTPLRVHVAKPGGQIERFEGRLVSTGDTLVMKLPYAEGEGSDTVRVVVSDVVLAAVSEGREPVSKTSSIAVGVLTGGIAFVATGFYLLSAGESGDLNIYGNQVWAVLIGVPVACGTLFGWLHARGAARSAPPAWREIPTSWLRGR